MMLARIAVHAASVEVVPKAPAGRYGRWGVWKMLKPRTPRKPDTIPTLQPYMDIKSVPAFQGKGNGGDCATKKTRVCPADVLSILGTGSQEGKVHWVGNITL